MAKLQTETLILTTAITAVRQWMTELTDKTTLTSEQIGEYSGDKKEIKPVTVSTYQILGGSEKHRELINSREWGLIIYDEVHTLPDANVAVEISGTFGSQQEEAQRLGCILRSKAEENQAWFYTLVTSDTVDEGFAAHRQLFLAEQGYPYNVVY